jgi:hypothetical protein
MYLATALAPNQDIAFVLAVRVIDGGRTDVLTVR